ncbi:MAG: helix-turn-helix transcriptional regulator, partial [Methylobacteriaceae bacterium]|nr:helix-turn-helix transcriptional regulator [Methylobacteriaceae bacterium]
YLGDRLLAEAGSAFGRAEPIALADRAWDVDDPFLTHAAERLAEASMTVRPGYTLFTEQLALSLAFHVVQRYPADQVRPVEPVPPPALPPRTLRRLVEFVRADPGAAITLQDLARVAGLSPSHLTRAFKRSTGTTPHRFVLRERLMLAQDLLSRSDLDLAEVALQSGFSSQSHLGAAFRTMTGLSPGRYRRLRRG